MQTLSRFCSKSRNSSYFSSKVPGSSIPACLSARHSFFPQNFRSLHNSAMLSAEESKVKSPVHAANTTLLKVSSNVIRDIGIVKFNTPGSKVNVLTMENGALINKEVDMLIKQKNVSGIVLMSENPGCFISGADINMIKSMKTEADVKNLSTTAHKLMNELENLSVPVVAAVSGHCLGGGLELAMACHSIVALDNGKTNFGFPEVLLGLLPGAGGTVRSFERLSPMDTISMILTGKMLRPFQAKKIGLVSDIVKPVGIGVSHSDDLSMKLLEEVAVQRALLLASENKHTEADYSYIKQLKYRVSLFLAEKQAFLKTRGKYPAAKKIIDTLRSYLDPKTNRYDKEAQAFSQLAMTNVASNLMSIYFKRTSVQKQNHGKPTNSYSHIGVIGAGLMGSGITEVSLLKGKYDMTCVDLSQKMLDSSCNSIVKGIDKKIKRKQMSNVDGKKLLTKIDFTTNFDDLKNVDLVIEAATENLDIKRKIVSQFEAISKPTAIFATNTSAIELKEISKNAQRPENIVGMHYFSPVPKMELLEIVKHPKLSPEALAAAVEVGRKQGKLCVVVGDCPGFYTTRILFSALTEIITLLNEGVSPLAIDRETLDFGFVFGSAALIDQVGVDVGLHITEYLTKEYNDRFGHVDYNILKTLVEKGNLGAKSNRGLYLYNSYKPILQNIQKLVTLANYDFTVYPILSNELKSILPKSLNNLSSEDIRNRIVVKFLNECVLCLQEGILDSPTDGDIAAIFGLGFPPFTGGPFQYIDNFGAKKLLDLMVQLNSKFKRNDFIPCDLLSQKAKDGTKFYS